MNKITRQSLANKVAERWHEQYKRYFDTADQSYGGLDKKEIYSALVALGPTPTPESVDEAIGNGSWTSCRCAECGSQVDAIMEVGEEPDYDSATANLCLPCLQQALYILTTPGEE